MLKAINIPFAGSSDQGAPLYEQVELWLESVIDVHFDHDERFFTERELIDHLKVSQPTVRRAMQQLVDKRVLRRRVGQGTFVQKFPVRRLVGLIAPYWNSPIFMQQINAFADACEESGCDLRMHYIHKGDSAREMARSLAADSNQERMVLWGQTVENAQILSDELGQRDFKSVCTFSYVSEFVGRSVGVDVAAGVRIALDYLIGLGHERIAFILNEPLELGTIQARIEVLRHEIEARGLSQCRFVSCESPLWSDSAKSAYDAMSEVLALKPKPTAIVPISALGAWSVLRYAAKHNLRVPEQFSVFSFANLPGSEWLFPSLTGLDVDWQLVAKKALQLLWSDATVDHTVTETVVPNLVERESVSIATSQLK